MKPRIRIRDVVIVLIAPTIAAILCGLFIASDYGYTPSWVYYAQGWYLGCSGKPWPVQDDPRMNGWKAGNKVFNSLAGY